MDMGMGTWAWRTGATSVSDVRTNMVVVCGPRVHNNESSGYVEVKCFYECPRHPRLCVSVA